MWLSATQKQGPPSPNPLLLRHGLSLSLFICFRKKKKRKSWFERNDGKLQVAKKTWKKIAMEEHHVNQQKKMEKLKLCFSRDRTKWNQYTSREMICGYHNSLHYFDIISLIDLCGDPALSQHILNYIDSSGELYSTNYQGKREAYLHIYHVGRDWIFIQRCLVTNRDSYMKWYLPT